MTDGFYSVEGWNRDREARERQQSGAAGSVLAAVPPDAPYDDPDAVLHVWTGEKWISYAKWLATAPFIADEKPAKPAIPADADCVAGNCGGVRICLDRDAQRWLMYVGAKKPRNRRRDFASPFLAHAIRTAEQWYGPPGGGWRAEKERDGKAADIHATEERIDEERES